MAAPLNGFARSVLEQGASSDEDSPKNEPKVRSGNFSSSWSVLTKTILGVGMLTVPWAAAHIGWIMAGVLLLGAGAFATLALHLLACVAIELGGEDTTFYSACARVAPQMRFFVEIAIAVKCLGVATSYLQVTGALVVSVIDPPEEEKFIAKFLVILAAVICMCPICFRRRIGKTGFTNWIALAGIVYVWILLVSYGAGNLFGSLTIPGQVGNTVLERTSMFPPGSIIDIITTIPVFIFSFTCHQNMFPIANEITEPSVDRLTSVALASVSTGVGIYGSCIIFGYAAFGADIDSNFLEALPPSVYVTAGKVFFAIASALSFPLQTHPCRRSLSVLLKTALKKTFEYPQRGERLMRRGLTFLILIAIMTFATIVDDLGLIFELVGAIGSNTMCYIMPTYLYIKTFWGKPHASWLMMRLALLQFTFGILLIPACLFSIFYKRLNASH